MQNTALSFENRAFPKVQKCKHLVLTQSDLFSIIALACSKETQNGGVAQLARALGSYPGCHRFKSSRRYQNGSAYTLPAIWPVGQVVKTPPFHGGIMGSNPVPVTIDGRLAQLGERLPYKQDVSSSILLSPTIF